MSYSFHFIKTLLLKNRCDTLAYITGSDKEFQRQRPAGVVCSTDQNNHSIRNSTRPVVLTTQIDGNNVTSPNPPAAGMIINHYNKSYYNNTEGKIIYEKYVITTS
jgi:hypothetical protein